MKKLSQEKIDKIIDLKNKNQKITQKEISRIVGCSQGPVCKYLREVLPSKQETYEKTASLYRSGKSIEEIGEMLSCLLYTSPSPRDS